VREQLVLVNVEDLEAAETWVLFNHLISNVHGFVVGVAHTCLNVTQVHRFLEFFEPFSLRPLTSENLRCLLLLREGVGPCCIWW